MYSRYHNDTEIKVQDILPTIYEQKENLHCLRFGVAVLI